MSFFAELRQRKVFRVTAAYLVVAWITVQAASIALPAFDAPPWVLRVVILAFALGFPLVLLLAWAVDLTPSGPKLEPRRVGNKRMAVVAVLLAALALAWFFLGQPAVRRQQAAAERSIAVLPFVNLSGDPANSYFSDGLAETTLDMLAQVPDLKVIARTSSFAFKGRDVDVREIGRILGAAHLLEGSVQQAGDTLRVTAQLVRASDGAHVWSRRFDRRRADVFVIQDEIATEVVTALQVALPGAARDRMSDNSRAGNVAAYEAYLKGIALLPGRRVPDMRRALAHFEEAIALDPSYARAHAMAGATLGLLEVYSSVTDEEKQAAVRHVDRALELAPELGEAHAARGAQLQRARDFAGAERAYRKAVEVAPGYATGHQWLGELLLQNNGNIEEGVPAFQRAFALDPLSPVIHRSYADALAMTGRLDEAEAELKRLLAREPDHAGGHDAMARVLGWRGDLVGALRAADAASRADPEAEFSHALRCHLYGRFDARREAAACLRRHAARLDQGDDRDAAEVDALVWEGRLAEALDRLRDSRNPDPWSQAYLLSELAPEEAEAHLRRLTPELFTDPPVIRTAYLDDLLVVGRLRASRGDGVGTALLEEAVRRAAARPAGAASFSRQWADAIGLAYLGRNDAACAALRASVQAGQFTNLSTLDVAPSLAGLRADSCYADALAPARRRAAEQVAQARAAGLLR
jgi:serine/threonine-protein kinase